MIPTPYITISTKEDELALTNWYMRVMNIRDVEIKLNIKAYRLPYLVYYYNKTLYGFQGEPSKLMSPIIPLNSIKHFCEFMQTKRLK